MDECVLVCSNGNWRIRQKQPDEIGIGRPRYLRAAEHRWKDVLMHEGEDYEARLRAGPLRAGRYSIAIGEW